jgi:hemerythrin
MATDLILFIKNWLLDHILVEDKKYADFFRENSFNCPEMDR